jgi:hypothetical protein
MNIIEMAREVEATPYTNRHYPDKPTYTFTIEKLERFARLHREQVLEEAAGVCESLFDLDDDSCNEAETCIAAIRALKEKA